MSPKMYRCVALLVVLLAYGSHTSAQEIRSCAAHLQLPTHAAVSGCEQSPCRLVHGTTVPILIVFDGLFNADTLRYQQVVTTGGTTQEMVLDTSIANTCDFLRGASCPVVQGQTYFTAHRIEILSTYPLVPVTIELSILDEQARTHACFVFDAEVAPPAPES